MCEYNIKYVLMKCDKKVIFLIIGNIVDSSVYIFNIKEREQALILTFNMKKINAIRYLF